MKALKMNEGEIIFGYVTEIDEFWQRVVNSLKIYNIECFYNESLALDIKMIDEQKISIYKLEHITSKLKEWYKDEIESIEYEIISEKERTLKAILKITHKEYSKLEKEVIISGKARN